MGGYSTIRVDRSETGLVTCTFDRPEVRHALNEAMIADIRRFLDATHGDGVSRLVIFTGAGEKAFLSGADIAELRDRSSVDALRRINSSLFREVEQYPLPTIAAIRGIALGGGLEFALACDLRVCGEGSRLGQPEVGLGIIPGAGATYRLPRIIGLGRAKDMILSGRVIGGMEAFSIGLANRVVADEHVMSEAVKLGKSVMKNGDLAVRLAKVALNTGQESGTDAGMAFESAAQALLFDDKEKRERMTAFLDRKK